MGPTSHCARPPLEHNALQGNPQMTRGKVFLIDDDPSVRRGLDRLIRTGGYDVETLADAQSYLEGPVPHAPACLLLDIRMPRMSGFELQNAISGTARALPVVFITGHGDEDVRVQALASGAVDVLFKPLDEAMLFEAIERALALPPLGRNGS
jgi:FixJ family two-component response regulator